MAEHPNATLPNRPPAPSPPAGANSDPVLSHLLQAGEQYKKVLETQVRQEQQLRQTQEEMSNLQAQVGTAQAQVRNLNQDLHNTRTELEDSRSALVQTRQELQLARAGLDQEQRRAEQHRERSSRLAEQIKQIHRSLFGPDGNINLLLLRACLNLTRGQRGLYLTARRDSPPFKIRAAIDVDGYPDAPPSEFLQALCRKVLAEDDVITCNDPADLSGLPEPQRDGEKFNNFMIAPVVLMKNLDGVILIADKPDGHFDEEDEKAIVSIGDHASIVVENERLRRDLQNSYVATVTMLADAVEAKDPYTRGHCEQVSRYARLIAEQLGLDGREKNIICYAALLHDVGKIGVSDGVLNKPGPLLPEEFDLVRSHVRTGQSLILNVPALDTVANVVLHHHEWYDGSGYPDGLKGEEIPLGSRIICAVDSYCAMITRRSYKEAYSMERARAELMRCAGTQFDPRVVEAFLTVLDMPEPNASDDEDDRVCGIMPGISFPGFETLTV